MIESSKLPDIKSVIDNFDCETEIEHSESGVFKVFVDSSSSEEVCNAIIVECEKSTVSYTPGEDKDTIIIKYSE